MGFFTIEYLCYCLTLIRSESSNIHERSDFLVRCCCDHCAGVGVPNKQNGAIDSFENAIECSGVV